VAADQRGARVRHSHTPKRQAEVILLDVEPIVEVGRRGDLEAGADVIPIQRERLECVGSPRVVQDPPRSRPKRRHIRWDSDPDGIAVDDQGVGQAGPEVAQVPAKAVAWVHGLMEQEIGKHMTFHRRVVERDAREQRERLRPQLERLHAVGSRDRGRAEQAQHGPIIGRPCAQTCARVVPL
jgi:hypothetical protein